MVNFTELDVWKKSRELANDIYSITKSFPKEELFGLTNQMRRAAVSVVSNIAEGCGRQHTKDAIQFFYIARGSAFELEAQVLIAYDQKYLAESILESTLEQLAKCKQLLNGFINYYKNRSAKNDTRNTNNEQ
ncbi:four helix bundle protein [Pontibacter sp. E15-1]|uniref:four helix bundle protein n=1 Tax=Pontibacter sp. E15-1 TaxID=2919918 RepID=UPI001F4F9638|nr:four helix bundle protein [Pontibacter sp. E15-1]MCJ8164940.1 four helix bundle protein [Pontibacter sp. E15-1]